jgi:predicted phage terminase large subunit-like protein
VCSQCWIAVDAANTETKAGSYTAFVALGFAENQLKVLNVHRGRWRQDKMQQQLVDFYHAIARQTGILPERVIVEQAAGGFGIIDHLSGQLPIEPIYPKGSKEDRAGAVCYIVNRGQVSLPESTSWKRPFVEELQNFPLCSSKDQVDAFVHGLSYAIRPSEFKPKILELGTFVHDTVEEDHCELDKFEEDLLKLEENLPRWGIL